MLVPKLRFKEFNDEWQLKKLNEISFEVKRKTTNTNYEVLTISAKKGFVSQKERFSKIIAGGSLEKYNLLKRNEISYNKGASKSFKYGCVYIQKQYDYALVPNVYISFSFINNNPYFYEKLFENHYLDKSLRMMITSTARQDGLLNIDRKQFFNIKVPVPSIEEQTKIANFLSLIDRKIELQEKLVENLNLYKKGLLKKVFSNNLGWNNVELYTVCDVRDGTHNSPKYTENGYPLVTSKNLSKNGQLDFSNISYISQKDFDEINKRSKVNVGDILFGMIGTIGNPVLLTKDEFAIKNVALIKEKTKLKNKFLIQFLNSSAIENQFNFNKTGGTQKFIALNSIRKLLVPVPSIEEQNQIANLFSNLDKKIELETKKLQDLKTYKKGLLQKMFI